MLGTAVIVFREVLEAALIVSILMAATAGVRSRNVWVGTGVLLGLGAAFGVALFAGEIAGAFQGVGQELFNATVLLTAVTMLAWHNIWMSQHSKKIVAHLKEVGAQISGGSLPLGYLTITAGLAVMREGSEVVLFMYGVAAGDSSPVEMLSGGLLGAAGGVAVGSLLYLGLVRIPVKWLFRVTGWIILLLAAGLAASAAGYLSQAGLLPSQAPLWNTGDILSEKSVIGQLLHILIGYQARPTAIQVAFYLATMALIGAGMKWIGREPGRRLQQVS
ncbi:FTR1 family iron permease [Methylohalobius crimeensis]|uniref:FTR1 family iron permease n=1 Tax=Methylohalobius crimeensis TaxID=244365 RepID=UPI0003B31D9B|nr:FTR1 family protein [Methylohalobius crimeensis]